VTVRALEAIKKMHGSSQSHLPRCVSARRDNLYFVVKFKNNPRGGRMLANEWIGSRLAQHMGIAVATAAIVRVDDEAIRSHPLLKIQYGFFSVACQPGQHFGSSYPYSYAMPTLLDYLPPELAPHIGKIRDFAAILVFDKWMGNTDSRQAIFIPERNCCRAMMIDHGFCFDGPFWRFRTDDEVSFGRYACTSVYDHVTSIDSFEPC
jgi:hypothetical protein